MKSRIHYLVDEEQNEIILAEVSRVLSGESESDILDDLTDEQLAKIEEAREQVRKGQGTLLADFKRKMEDKWPQLKSL